jgi:tetratricopeptide (TPR) repeat protein
MDNPTFNEQMMLYLDGELLGSAKDDFEKQLSADPALKEELERLIVAKESVRMLGLKQDIASLHVTMMNELGKSHRIGAYPVRLRRMVRYGLAIAASALVIFMGIEGYRFYELTPDNLFKEHYSIFELSSSRGSVDSVSAIEKAYRDRDFPEVITVEAKQNSPVAKNRLLAGIAYLETGEIEQAIITFQQISEAGSNSLFKDASQYYLALAFLKKKQYDKSLQLLQAIHNNPTHLYRDQISNSFIRQVKRLKWKEAM